MPVKEQGAVEEFSEMTQCNDVRLPGSGINNMTLSVLFLDEHVLLRYPLLFKKLHI